MNRTRVLSVSSVVALVAAGSAVLLVRPGDAAEPGLTYAAVASGDVLRIREIDQDFSGDPQPLDLAGGRASGETDVAKEPRSRAVSANLAGAAAGAPVSAVSNATSSTDTLGPTTASAPAGTAAGVLEHGTASLASRARWSGDAACTPAGSLLTSARTDTATMRTVPTEIPTGLPGLGLPLPTGIPTEIPTELPTGLPTLPTGLPTTGLPTILPTLPTGLPTLPTGLPTTLIPTILPTITLPTGLPAPARESADPVSLVQVAPTSVVATTGLQAAQVGQPEGLTSRVTAAPGSTAGPALTFFGGEATVTLGGATRLTAYSPGSGASTVTHEQAPMTLSAGGQQVPIPATGAVAVPSTENEDVVLLLSRGVIDEVEDPTGRVAGAQVAALDIVIKNGDELVLRAEYLPMEVRTQAPQGGVLCPRDTDGDGLLDSQELGTYGTDPERADTDGDKLSDGLEVKKYRTNPLKKDTDGDRLNDRVEVKKYKTNPKKLDTDRDKLNDRIEVKKYKTNPRKKDTDRDGVSDFKEVKRGTDPLKG